MTNQPAAEEQVRFLLNVQRLLEEGSSVSTYKHALPLSITDVCVERGGDSDGHLRISTDERAEKFIRCYWRHTVPYHPSSKGRDGIVLKQSTGMQAAVLRDISDAREEYGGFLTQLSSPPACW